MKPCNKILFATHYTPFARKAFTLAEVLITLGIIGIIAEITIPDLYNNMKEQQTVGMLKKEYSVISQAYTMAVQENGTPDTWGLVADIGSGTTTGGGDIVVNKLSPYLKMLKICGSSPGCFNPGVTTLYLKGSGGLAFDSEQWWSKFQLADGSVWAVQVLFPSCTPPSPGNNPALSSVCAQMEVDINGLKAPNTWGKDTFGFYMTKAGIIPKGTQQSKDAFKNYCDEPNPYGTECTAWVIYNENMEYLHCQGLDWNGPTKCQ